MRKTLLAVFTLLFLFSAAISLKAQNAKVDSLINIGHELSSESRYGEAAEQYRIASLLLEESGDVERWVSTLLVYGVALVRQGEVREGRDVFIDLYENRRDELSQKNLLKTLNNIGWANRRLEQPVTARDYYLKALDLAEILQDSIQIGRVNNNISYTYQETGDYETAFKHQRKALDIFEAIQSDRMLALGLNSTFFTLMELGLYEQATPYIRRSVELREKLNNLAMMDVGYHNLAWNLQTRGEIDSAIVYYQKSLELTRQIGNPYEITQTLMNIGNLYESSGDYTNALAYYNEALQYNYETKRPASTAENLVRIARIAVETKDYENAHSFYNEGLEWLDGTSQFKMQVNIYLDLAELEIIEGRNEEARKYLSLARKILKDKDFHALEIKMHGLIGQLLSSEGNFQKSLAEYQKSYRQASTGSLSGLINATKNLAKVYHKLGSDTAYFYAEKAFTLIDSIRTNVAGVEFKSGLFRDHAIFYNEVASWYILDKEPEKAFELVEAAKARVLMDELAVARENSYSRLNESTLIRKQQLTKQIDRLHNQLLEVQNPDEKEELQYQLKELEFRYHTFLNELQVSSQALKDFKYPEPMRVQQAMELVDRSSAILEYAITDSEVLCFLIKQGGITASKITDPDSENQVELLSAQIKNFREAITEERSLSEVQKMGADIYSMVIPHILNEHEIENIVIIPAGPLTFLPFDALRKDGQYLAELYNIKYLPSASIYPLIEEPKRDTEFELLAVAGSGFDTDGSGNGNQTSTQSNFSSLPSTLLEVDSISVHFENYKVLKNEEVSEATLKSYDLSDFRFMHFATHAEVNEENPSQSGLLLSKKTDIETLFGEDGYLNSREISTLNLNADLVTLSACNTGMGKVVTGEGLLGLQRSFISAGASSVMVSLWSIYDRSTSVFMADFYKKMLVLEEQEYGMMSKTLNWLGMYDWPLFDYKTKALREAKIDMIEHPYYNHPVYWAPFIIIGK